MWQSCRVTNSAGYDSAIEVAANHDTIDTDPLDKIINMAHQHIERGIGVLLAIFAQVVNGEIQTDQSLRFSNSIKLLIGQIACRWAYGVYVGVRRHQGRIR